VFRVSNAIEAFTQEVLNGKFSSAEEALRLMRSRIGSTMGRKR